METNSEEREKLINVKKISNISMLEYSNYFTFENRKIDEQQLICVYRGKSDIIIEDKRFSMTEAHMVIVPEGSGYTVKINKNDNPILLIISFQCSNNEILSICGRSIFLSSESIAALNEILLASNNFINPSNVSYQYYDMSLHNHISTLKYQILRNKLELFLLDFIDTLPSISDNVKNPYQTFSKQKLISSINSFLKDNIDKNITLDELSAYFNMSTSYMSSIYRNGTGNSIIQSFNNMKIELAKNYIEQRDYNITQISDKLGFSSVHYFSRIFKKIVGVSPIQYEHEIHNRR